MITSLRSREKKRVIEQLLIGDHVLLHLVPQAPGVELPSHLMENLTVTLKISRHFRGALLLHNDYIEAHLLFGDSYCECRVPYDAIWGVTSEYGDTTSWLDGFNDMSSPPSGRDTEKDSNVLSTLLQRSSSQLTSGSVKPSADKSDQKTTPLQIIEPVGTQFEQGKRGDVDLDATDSTDKQSNGVLSENSEAPDGLAPEDHDDDLVEPLDNDEENESPSFPPRLQSVSRMPSDETLLSGTSVDVSKGEGIPEGKEKPSSPKKAPSPSGRQSGKSDQANRPKLVRVK